MQHISLRELEDFLTVGVIEVTLDETGIGYEARAGGVSLTGVDLGADVCAPISCFDLRYGDEDDDEHAEFDAGSVEMFVELMTRVRDVLASYMLVGRMNVGIDGFGSLDEEDAKNAVEATESRREEFFEIDLYSAFAARKGLHDREAALTGGLKALLDIMREEGLRRGLNKEEREKLTIGEALGLGEEEEGVER